LIGLATALRQRPDPCGQELLKRMAQFQSTSFQPDGQFAHIGFQIGELVHEGLIHNVVPCVALAIAAPTEQTDRAIRQVLTACDTRSGAWPGENSVGAAMANPDISPPRGRLHGMWPGAVGEMPRDSNAFIGRGCVSAIAGNVCRSRC